MKPAEDDELEEEAEWIYRNAFSTPTISMQVEPNCEAWSLLLCMLKDPSGDDGSCSRKAQTIWIVEQPLISAGRALAPLLKSKRPWISWGTSTLRYSYETNQAKLKMSRLMDGCINLPLLPSTLQVPFIAFYRKEYVEPELNINDLWKVWQWDEKVRASCIWILWECIQSVAF